MKNLLPFEYIYAQEHQEMIKEDFRKIHLAEKIRNNATQIRKSSLLEHLLARFGEVLIETGMKLKQRYEHEKPCETGTHSIC